MRLTDRIADLCKTANITFAGLEKALGFGKGTMYRWNDNLPSIDKVQKVADYFGVSVDYLMGREPVDEVQEMLEYLHKEPQMKVLLSSSSKLKKKDLDAVVAIVQRMNGEDYE